MGKKETGMKRNVDRENRVLTEADEQGEQDKKRKRERERRKKKPETEKKVEKRRANRKRHLRTNKENR